jgi:hypothetical protein
MSSNNRNNKSEAFDKITKTRFLGSGKDKIEVSTLV